MRAFRAAAAAAFFCIATFPIFATTLIPLSDHELVERADAVVSGTVVDSTSRFGDGGYVFTDYRVRIEASMKRSVPSEIVISEAGGVFGDRFTIIADSATYARGEHVLAFVRQRADGTWFTASMARGKFTYSANAQTLTNAATESTSARVMNAEAFVRYVRDVVRGVPASGYASMSALQVPPTVEANPPASAYCLQVGDQTNVIKPVRIAGGESGQGLDFYINGTQTSVANATTLIANAAAAWTGDPNSGIVVKATKGTDTSAGPSADSKNVIYLGTSVAPPAGTLCDSANACAVIYGTTDHTFNGESFHSIAEADILVRPAVGSSQFGALMTHEFGHTIGFRHADAGQPSSSFAIMTAVIQSAFGTTLQQWDKDAVDTVYGNGPVCNPATISAQSQSATVAFNSRTNLSVTAAGSSPTYQWYQGPAGDTSHPINGATNNTYTTDALTQTTSFWVQVSTTCGTANSATITLTVTPCTAPQITTQPSGLTINSGGSATLSFSSSGTSPLSVQWYQGTAPDTSTPVAGATNNVFNTPALTQQTSYWAKVSNACGSAATNTVTISIAGQCVAPSITTQPKDQTIDIGKSTTLTVVATNTDTYQWYQGASGDTSKPISGATTQTLTTGEIFTAGPSQFWVKVSNACASANSSTATVNVSCVAPRPIISVPAVGLSSTGFTVRWDGDGRIANRYELQEATNAAFNNATTFTITDGTSRNFAAKNNTVDTRYFYRVRSFAICGGDPSEYSGIDSILVTAPTPANSSNFNFAEQPCNCTITQQLNIGGFNKSGKTALETQDTFSISSDAPFVTVSPSSGNLPADGTTVTVTIDTSQLTVGSTQGTLTVNKSSSTPNLGTLATTSTSIPLTVSLVSPVTPTAKDAAPSNTLLVPAVAHADGVGTQFVSDVRVTNTSASPLQYLLSYTPGGIDGTTSGKQMQVTIKGGDTLALNDIVKSWFGAGALGEGGIGSIEIRPLNDNVTGSHATVAASRTYAVTPTGTFGQFIPALPLSNFLAKSASSFISLQQIAQSTSYRTNFGFVEGSGKTADLELRLFNSAGQLIDTKNLTLKPYELAQLSLQQVFGSSTTLTDGRMEARVISDTGKVSAYASVLDNRTNDPLLVLPVDPTKVSENKFVLPGIGDFDIGVAHWKSDVRLYNAGTSAVTSTLTYYPQGNGTPRSFDVTVQPGETRVLDNFIAAQFTGVTQTAGSLVATAPANSSLVATARTYTDTGSGTYGQFIPGITPTEGVGAGERMLQVLQLEESPSFHTNAGVVELTGNPVHVKVHAYVPDGRTSGVVELDLAPYEFRQLNRVFASMGYGTTYNGRIAVEVTSGDGRITAYGSNIDNRTQDPTYVPAQ